MDNRLYRSPTDKVIGGVAGGLAVWMNLDPSLIRLAWVLLAIFSGGIFVLVYFVLMLVVPLAPVGWVPRPPSTGAPGGGPGQGWGTPGGPPPPGSWGQPMGSTGPPPGAWSSPPGTWGAPPTSTSWNRPSTGNNNAGIVAGIVLILLGTWFLVDRYVHIDWSLLWPVIIIVLGVGLLAAAMRRGRPAG